MKFISPHDPLDEWIAAALHGELTPEEQTRFETRLQQDAAARAAYQEAQVMHDLLEKTYRPVQPDSAFEQRIVAGVRRKIQDRAPAREDETAWESVLVLWTALRRFMARRRAWEYAMACAIILMLGLATNRIDKKGGAVAVFNVKSIDPRDKEGWINYGQRISSTQNLDSNTTSASRFGINLNGYVDPRHAYQFAGQIAMADQPTVRVRSGEDVTANTSRTYYYPNAMASSATPQLGTALRGSQGFTVSDLSALLGPSVPPPNTNPSKPTSESAGSQAGDEKDLKKIIEDQKIYGATAQKGIVLNGNVDSSYTYQFAGQAQGINNNSFQVNAAKLTLEKALSDKVGSSAGSRADLMAGSNAGVLNGNATEDKGSVGSKEARLVTKNTPNTPVPAETASAAPAAPVPQETNNANRKLVRNADLELEVKSFQAAMDRITELTKAAGGYVDTGNSQRGGNGKLQGIVVVKVLPQNLDAFLLKLRDLGELKNETVKADDVTKQYFDTQARIENARRMETQLQELLQRTNGKVSELLQVERELGRVRGEIEQMQGQLKLYDFQVQYATVTMHISEKDLNEAAAYLLKEQDQFSLFATDVEGAFQKARRAAEDLNAPILAANLNRAAGSNISAELTVLVAPEQIESFLAQVKALGRVDQFTRQTERVANDGGNGDQPAEQTRTQKDKVQVNLAIKFDDDSRKHVALTVVTPAVDQTLDQAKAAVLAVAGAEILNASLNKTAQGQSAGLLAARVPGKNYPALLEALRGLGRTLSFSLQREDQSETHDGNAPVIISLQLTDNDVPQQQTEIFVLASEVDATAQDVKKQAVAAGAKIKASGFERQPDGRELAQMTFLLPMAKYAGFIENLKKLGQVESLTVRREDRPDQTQADEAAPAEITLRLRSQGNLIADDHGFWATLRQTFGEGAAALLGSLKTIGVAVAFLAPWVFLLAVAAWLGRRIYIWRRK